MAICGGCKWPKTCRDSRPQKRWFTISEILGVWASEALQHASKLGSEPREMSSTRLQNLSARHSKCQGVQGVQGILTWGFPHDPALQLDPPGPSIRAPLALSKPDSLRAASSCERITILSGPKVGQPRRKSHQTNSTGLTPAPRVCLNCPSLHSNDLRLEPKPKSASQTLRSSFLFRCETRRSGCQRTACLLRKIENIDS